MPWSFVEAHFLWEMTSCLSPYSALCLVQQRIHALRQSMEFLEGSPYSALCLVQQWIQVHASDYGGWVFASVLTPRAVLFFPLVRPMIRCIMAGIFQKDICPRSSSSSLSWCGGRSPWFSDHRDYTVAVRQGFFVPVCWLCSSTGAGCGGDSRDPSVASCSSPSCR